MTQATDTAPETTFVDTSRVWCDGAGDIRGGADYRSAALGHPRVWIEIDEKGYADCGYCDRRFALKAAPEGH
jgi:NADH dehydrogenase (ubiquinone) Fe-S protein 6